MMQAAKKRIWDKFKKAGIYPNYQEEVTPVKNKITKEIEQQTVLVAERVEQVEELLHFYFDVTDAIKMKFQCISSQPWIVCNDSSIR